MEKLLSVIEQPNGKTKLILISPTAVIFKIANTQQQLICPSNKIFLEDTSWISGVRKRMNSEMSISGLKLRKGYIYFELETNDFKYFPVNSFPQLMRGLEEKNLIAQAE